MAHTRQTFQYCPLDLANHEIRLVHLQSRQFSDEIHCSLAQVTTEHNPLYEALSYEWGLPSNSPCWVTLDGKLISVRENLWFALRDLRLADRPRVLWIDALCINQDDTVEKNHQVALMGEIYRKAARVIVWIGPEEIDTKKSEARFAITLLDHLRRRPLTDFLEVSNPNGLSMRFASNGYYSDWVALLRLCMRTYWARLWIIQEVLLASELVVHCGELNFHWRSFTNLFTALGSPSIDSSFDVVRALRDSTPARLNQQRIVRKEAQDGSPLLQLLLNNADASCVDIRDKVWGIHSLVKPCCQTAVPIDYNKNVIDLCSEVLRHEFLAHSERNHAQDARRLRTILLPAPFLGKQPIRWVAADFQPFPWLTERGYLDASCVRLHGQIRGRIAWFGSHSLCDREYQPWMAQYMNKYGGEVTDRHGVRFGTRKVQIIPEFLKENEWSTSIPTKAITELFLDIQKLRAKEGRSRSVFSAQFAELAPKHHSARKQLYYIRTSDAISAGRNTTVNGMFGKLISGAGQTLGLVPKIKNKSLSNAFDGDRILGLTEGVIASAPQNAKIGDLVCGFGGCNFFVVMRRNGVSNDDKKISFEIVGSAGYITKDNYRDLVEDIEMHLDVVTLQKLCWDFPLLAQKKGAVKSNDPDECSYE